MKMNKKVILYAGIFLAAAVALAGCGKKEGAEVPTSQAVTESGSEAVAITDSPSFSNFKSVTLEGDEVSQDIFSDYDLTMVNIWATFCSPCLREMPDLAEIHEEYKDKGVQIIGIVSDVVNSNGTLSESQLDTAREIVEETGAGYTHLIPTYDLMMAKLKDVSVVPTTFFVDKDGNPVGEEILGSKSKEDWLKIIDDYLGEVK